MHHDTVQDPVCGMKLSIVDAVASTEWSGRRYYFCSEACSRSFVEDPSRHLVRTRDSATVQSIRIPIVGLACAAGDRLPLERGLGSVPGVIEAYVNPADEVAYLDVDPERFRIAEAVAEIERFGGRAIAPRAPREVG